MCASAKFLENGTKCQISDRRIYLIKLNHILMKDTAPHTLCNNLKSLTVSEFRLALIFKGIWIFGVVDLLKLGFIRLVTSELTDRKKRSIWPSSVSCVHRAGQDQTFVRTLC